jgi:hypothetical protein
MQSTGAVISGRSRQKRCVDECGSVQRHPGRW